jgi:alanyl aminopeptidase
MMRGTEKAMRLALAALLAFTESSALAQAPESPPEPPKLRLPAVARPLRQTVSLTIVPDRETFAGTTDIELELKEPTRLLWLNASQLSIRDARLALAGTESLARVVPGGDHFAGFAFERPVGPGRARLRIAYEGALDRRDTQGLFAQQEGGDWYVFTQFEPLAARRAFPCFDEPSYKIPWTVKLRVPKDLVAVSNAPQTSSVEDAEGSKTVSFAETPPMPSYLVALGVGPFELVDGGRAGRNKTPLRIITPRGRAAEARWAKETSPAILELLEDYFDSPYPYAKLDQIAIPITVSFGAMENAGLITYDQSILLRKPADETVSFRRGFAATAAHELAHMWFGNLVTTAWWDDIWLNEAFASWMGDKIVDRWKPEWDEKVQRVFARGGAMSQDGLASARKIRQPIATNHDVVNAFDGITYSKGQVVLGMFEAWLGEASFRKGVQQYLKQHGWGNATATDFVAALSSASGRDVAPPFGTFLEQTGVPLVTAKLSCSGDRPWLLLSQRPYLPIGSKADAARRWQIPVCVEHAAAVGRRQCTLLSGASAELALENASSCPAWVLLNDEATGYYRAHSPELLESVRKDGGVRLSVAERVALLQDLGALVRSGDLPAARALEIVPPMLQDPNRHLVRATSSLVLTVASSGLLTEASRPKLASFVRESFGARARALGWTSKPGDDEDTRLLRASLVGLVARAGEDPELCAAARATAGRNGDRALFEAYRRAAGTEKDRLRRQRMLTLLGSFRDPGIARDALSLPLDPGLETRETFGVLFSMAAEPSTRQQTWESFQRNYDAIVARTPAEAQGFLVFTASTFCDAEARANVESFFKPRVDKVVGGPRNLARVLEGIDLCIAYKDAQQASVLKFLDRY